MQRTQSVVEVTLPSTVVKGVPCNGGLLDLRMGVVDRTSKCAECGKDYLQCPGHLGHIELAQPLFHAGHLETVLKLLRCVCFHCSRLLVPENAEKRKRLGLSWCS